MSGDHRERAIDGQTAVSEARPGGLVVGLDGGPVFREGELGAAIRVGVAVGNVMHELAHGPAAFAVRSVELQLGESVDSALEGGWKQAEGGNLPDADGRVRGRGPA